MSSDVSELPWHKSLTKIRDLNDHLVLSNHRFGDIGWDFMAVVDPCLSCDVKSGMDHNPRHLYIFIDISQYQA